MRSVIEGPPCSSAAGGVEAAVERLAEDLDALFGLGEERLAAGSEAHALVVERDGVIEAELAALEALRDLLEPLVERLEALRACVGRCGPSSTRIPIPITLAAPACSRVATRPTS